VPFEKRKRRLLHDVLGGGGGPYAHVLEHVVRQLVQRAPPKKRGEQRREKGRGRGVQTSLYL
jgi:hypothetical protein